MRRVWVAAVIFGTKSAAAQVATDAGVLDAAADAAPDAPVLPSPAAPDEQAPTTASQAIADEALRRDAVARLAHEPAVRCDTGLYAEPSVFVVGSWSSRPGNADKLSLLHRVSAGVLLRFCEPSPMDALHLRIGATAYVGQVPQDGAAGIGLEAEVDYPIAGEMRFGGRLGVETARGGGSASGSVGAALFTFGARIYPVDALWFGLDVFHMTEPNDPGTPSCNDSFVLGCTASTTGVMLGVGVAGRAGAYVEGVEVALGGLLLLLLSNANWQ